MVVVRRRVWVRSRAGWRGGILLLSGSGKGVRGYSSASSDYVWRYPRRWVLRKNSWMPVDQGIYYTRIPISGKLQSMSGGMRNLIGSWDRAQP